MKQQRNKDVAYQMAGWALFVVCALFYLASSVKHHDLLAGIGSVLFLIACVLFLVPLIGACQRASGDTDPDDR